MAQIQLKCPNCQQHFEAEVNENADPAALVKAKCPSCGIHFQTAKKDVAESDTNHKWGERKPLPEDYEVILDMELHSAYDIPRNRKYRLEDFQERPLTCVSTQILFFLQCFLSGCAAAAGVLLPLFWGFVTYPYLKLAYTKYTADEAELDAVSDMGAEVMFLFPTIPGVWKYIVWGCIVVVVCVMTFLICANRLKACCCPYCSAHATMVKIKSATLVQSEIVPKPILKMRIIKCLKCGTEITQKAAYPSILMSLIWFISLIELIVICAAMFYISVNFYVLVVYAFLFIVSWGVLLSAPLIYGECLRCVTPDSV